MQAKMISFLIAIALLFLECNCCSGGGSEAVTKDTFDNSIPMTWKLKVTEMFDIKWEELIQKPVIYVDGVNYYDLGDNRRVPITLEPFRNHKNFNDDKKQFFSIKIRIPTVFEPDYLKPIQQSTVNGTSKLLAYTYVSSSYNVLRYSSVNPQNYDNAETWKVDSSKPILFQTFGNQVKIDFSIRKA
ncbi:uncharacterized protein LOC130677469 [Microplitis mediator]|uniref:uncharacterized protein LOC130677469 n=1 Tax=Microplitis mediator TaxID=375433 RepID=UPI00255284E2|nr:uncharacterized protein LOC130677469 [Microplitis mediator]